jgi:hypothetical protein
MTGVLIKRGNFVKRHRKMTALYQPRSEVWNRSFLTVSKGIHLDLELPVSRTVKP